VNREQLPEKIQNPKETHPLSKSKIQKKTHPLLKSNNQ